MKWWVIGVALVVFVVAYTVVMAKTGHLMSTSTANDDSGTPTPAVMLASIQHGYDVDSSDMLAWHFRQQLTAMRTLCTEPTIRIADYTVTAHRALAKRGIHESYFSILSHVRRSIPKRMAPTKCMGIFAAYEALRIG